MKKIIAFIASLFMFSACINPQKSGNKKEIVKGMAQTISKKFKNAPQLSIEDFNSLKEKPVLIDVREAKERAVSILPGAISLEEFKKNKSIYKDKMVVAYCTIGYRSSEYVENLKEEGFNAFNLSESILGWAHRGLDFEHQGQKTKRAHVYSEAWNFLPEGYEGIFDD